MFSSKADLGFGDQIGRYRLVAEIARGGMGVVYLAAASGPAGFSRLTALKQLRPEFVENTGLLTMFLEEARLAARLSHPHIVQTSDVDIHEDQYFLVMEYLEGRSFHRIKQRLADKGGFPLNMGISVLRDVLDALDYAHGLAGTDGTPIGFVHRDVSPQNIFITFDGHTKVIDFGISKARDSSVETKIGVLKGRTSYMAPEQLESGAEPRSDLFAVGAILFELVTGQPLWHGLNEMEILGQLARGQVPPVKVVRSDLPPALIEICRIALSARVEDRFASAKEMRDALDDYLWSTGGDPQMRDIAELLAKEFSIERANAQNQIKQSLARLQNGEAGPLERIGSGVLPVDRTRASDKHPVSATAQTIFDAPTVAGAPAPKRSQKERLRRKTLALGATVVLFAGVVGALSQRGAGEAGAALSPLRSSAVASETHIEAVQAQREAIQAQLDDIPSAARPVDTILLSISATPASAKIFVDGDAMPTNPFVAHFPRSIVMRRIRVTASGFQSKESLVSFTDNVMLDLSLRSVTHDSSRKRESTPTHESPYVARFAPPQAAPTPATPLPSYSRPSDIVPRKVSDGPHRRPIDARNPYGEAN